MKRISKLHHEFVTAVPERLDAGVLYVSMEFATAIHSCCCGCAREVVTPLTPTDWKMTFDGVSVSLYPSIGNWSFDCRSHYWITRDVVRWAGQWSDEEIAHGRQRDHHVKEKYFGGAPVEAAGTAATAPTITANGSYWSRVRKWFS
jgi:hypothetical protein